jgi:hypothetical protein
LISQPPGPDICTPCNRRACEKAWQDAVEIDRATVVASMANTQPWNTEGGALAGSRNPEGLKVECFSLGLFDRTSANHGPHSIRTFCFLLGVGWCLTPCSGRHLPPLERNEHKPQGEPRGKETLNQSEGLNPATAPTSESNHRNAQNPTPNQSPQAKAALPLNTSTQS